MLVMYLVLADHALRGRSQASTSAAKAGGPIAARAHGT